MTRTVLPLAFAAALVAPLPLGAHPHVFVDTEMTLSVDEENRVTGVRMQWRYDEFITLLILEDMGIDMDGDGVLTEEESARLLGFDLSDWPEGFEGDLYVERDGEKVEMPRPEAVSAKLENGQLVSVQTRAIPPVPVEVFELRQYDPTFYVQYTLAAVEVDKSECKPALTPADPTEAEQFLAEQIDDPTADPFAVVELGVHYSDLVKVTCAPSS